MSSRAVSIVALLALLALLAVLGAPADAARNVRYSGTVVAIDAAGGVLVMDEVGPWRVERGATVLTRRTITLTPSTRYNLFMRVAAPGAFAGDFIEVELDVHDIVPGAFVTVQCIREGGRLVALGVTMAELP